MVSKEKVKHRDTRKLNVTEENFSRGIKATVTPSSSNSSEGALVDKVIYPFHQPDE